MHYFPMLRTTLASCAGAVAGGAAVYLAKPSVPASEPPSPPPVEPWRRLCTHGLPVTEHLHLGSAYASSVSFRDRIPLWVAEHLTSADRDGDGVDRSKSRFRSDEAVPGCFRATNEDYRGSALSRGHMAPAGAHKQSQDGLNETFLLSSNILPQELSNNGSDWLRLERFVKDLTKTFSDVHVVSGPLFLPEALPDEARSPLARKDAVRKRVTFDVIGDHAVAVPTHLYKVVLAEGGAGGERRLSAFVLPNGPVPGHPPLDSFVVPLEQVEASAGLVVFPELSEKGAIAPLCGGELGACGIGAMDGRIAGWKMLGNLKLSSNCLELRSAWAEVEGHGGLDNMRMMSQTKDSLASSMACEWQPPKAPLKQPEGAAPPEEGKPPSS